MQFFMGSSQKLFGSDLDVIFDVWNRKGRRIAVQTHIQTLISLCMQTIIAHAQYQAIINITNTTISKVGDMFPRVCSQPLTLPLP